MADDEQHKEPDEDEATVLPAREAFSIIAPVRGPDLNDDPEDEPSSHD